MLNGAEAVIITDSVGTHSYKLRDTVCGDVEGPGIHLDREKNHLAPANQETFIEDPGSSAHIMVIPTDEESVIRDKCSAHWRPKNAADGKNPVSSIEKSCSWATS